MTQTDQELVAGVVQGEQQAFALLFARYRATVRHHLLRMHRDEATADDLTQEVFLRLWRRAEQWQGEAAFNSWLLRIATNLSLNHLRTVKRRREQPMEVAAPIDAAEEEEDRVPPGWLIDASTNSPDGAIIRDERRRLLQGVIGELSEEKQEVIRMVYDAHMHTREVALQLGIPQGTVKSRLHHARRELARTWAGLGLDWEDV